MLLIRRWGKMRKKKFYDLHKWGKNTNRDRKFDQKW